MKDTEADPAQILNPKPSAIETPTVFAIVGAALVAVPDQIEATSPQPRFV